MTEPQPSGTRFPITKVVLGCLAWGLVLVLMIGGLVAWALGDDLKLMFRPSDSPDRVGRIVYAADYSGNFEIYAGPPTSDLDARQRLTRDPGSDLHPAWSPDGTRIAFSSDRHGTLGIYVMNADGSNVVMLTENGAEPAWSPDGSRIVFSTESGLHLIDATGENGLQLTSDNDFSPAWSPDGTRILFSRRSSAGFNSDIFSVNPDGTGVAQLTQAEDHSDSPVWSPDGTQIDFSSDRTVQYQLYIMNADGSRLRQITEHSGQKHVMPAWSPDMEYLLYQTSHPAIKGNLIMIHISSEHEFSYFGGEAEERDPDWSPIP
jgi:Tol biopolymer transport system component